MPTALGISVSQGHSKCDTRPIFAELLLLLYADTSNRFFRVKPYQSFRFKSVYDHAMLH